MQLEGRIQSGDDPLDEDLRDIGIVTGPGGVFLYAASGQNGGISVYELHQDGRLASLSDTTYFTVWGMGVGRFDLVTLDGSSQLILAGVGRGELIHYGIGAGDGLATSDTTDLPGTSTQTHGDLAAVALTEGRTGLYTVDADTGALGGWRSDGTGGLVEAVGLLGDTGAFTLSGSVVLAATAVGAEQFLLAADSGTQGVHSYEIVPETGALSATGFLGAADGLSVALPTALETVNAHDATWAVLAAADSNTLSVMQLLETGELIPTDHILDTRATRFAGVTALEVIEVDGHVFVLAGGADDGLSLFTLLPGGRLAHMQSLAHEIGSGLDNVTGITAARMGNEIQIFVTSGGDSGLSQFSLSLENLGSVIEAGDGFEPLNGQVTLQGQAGDDILISDARGGILTGGAGADLFVLCPTTEQLEITDFQVGIDQLDLTQFPMLRGVGQLTLTSTGTGIRIGYRTTQINVISWDETLMTAADLWPDGFLTPDRIFFQPAPVETLLHGTMGADVLLGGVGVDRILAMADDDQVWAGAGNDRVFGGAGDDLLFGEGGDDELVGDAGADRLEGGVGADQLLGGTGNDLLFGGEGADRLIGQDGDDQLNGDAGADRLEGWTGADQLLGGSGNDLLFGGAGADQLFGEDGDDQLNGDAGVDRLEGGAGVDLLFGGGDNDLLFGGDGDDRVIGQDGDDQLNGDAGADRIEGWTGADQLFGGSGNDLLFGGRGEDVIAGQQDDDVMYGGPDADLFLFNTGHGVDTITDFVPGTDRIQFDIEGLVFADLDIRAQGTDAWIYTRGGSILLKGLTPDDLLADDFFFQPAPVETLLHGTMGADVLLGGVGVDRILAMADDDQVWAGAGNDRVFGGAGDDLLFGEGGDDELVGDAGADRLEGGVGADQLLGGTGNDLLFGGEGADRLIGQDGDDQLNGDAGADRLEGWTGADQLLGGSGNDLLFGGAGADQLFGEDGDDQLNGDAGVDRLEGGAGVDLLFGGGDNDLLFGGDGDDRVIGQDGDDQLNGDAGADRIEGWTGADQLFGGSGNDLLFGGRGEDVIAGQQDDDVMYGGPDADLFLFNTGHGVDTITDFVPGTDRIQFDIEGLVFADLDIRAQGTDAWIYTRGGSILLKGLTPDDLLADDFFFL